MERNDGKIHIPARTKKYTNNNRAQIWISVTPGDMKFSDNINLYSVSNWAYSSIRSTQRSLTKTANTSSTVPVNTPLFASNGWFELYADL